MLELKAIESFKSLNNLQLAKVNYKSMKLISRLPFILTEK
jgi:hypothetical protein